MLPLSEQDGDGPLGNKPCSYSVINILIFVQDNPSEHILSSCNVWYKLAVMFAALAIVMIISAFPETEDALMLARSGTFQEASVDVFTHCLQIACTIVKFIPLSAISKCEHTVHLKN